MTIRQLLGWTKHMGPFEISVAWLAVPDSIKSKLPADVRNTLNSLSAVIATYKVVIKAYSDAKAALDKLNSVAIASSPSGPPAAAGLVTSETAKAVTSSIKDQVFKQFDPINTVLDTPIPGL